VTLVWAASYSIHDLDPYFLPPIWSWRSWPRPVSRHRPESAAARPFLGSSDGTWMALVLVLGIAGFQAFAHLPSPIAARIDSFARTPSLLRALPERAILISRHWTDWFRVDYLQEIEGVRRT